MDRAVLVGEDAARLFDAVERLAARMEREGRPFVLLILQPNVPVAPRPRYVIMASAPWLDDLSDPDAIGTVYDLLWEEMGGWDRSAIDRVWFLNTQDPFVAAVAMRLPNQSGWVGRAVVRGIELDEVYVVTLTSPEAVARAETPLIEIRPPAKQAREPVRRRKAR